MQLSSAYKERLAKAARLAGAGALVVSSFGTAFAPVVSAARITSNSIQLSDTRPSATTQYKVTFRPTGTTGIKQINLKFCEEAGNYGDTCTDPTASHSAAYTAASATVAGFTDGTGPNNTVDGSSSASGNVISIVLTTVGATESAVTDHVITLPGQTNATVAQTYYVRMITYSDTGSTSIDAGETAFALVQPVTVSGTVLESLTFQVLAVTAGTCGTGAATVTATTATATAIPFGNYVSGTPRVGCHTVSTATNATAGYSTVVQTVNPGSAPQGAMCRQTASNCSSIGGSNTVASGDYIADAGLTSTAASWTNGTTFGLGVNANSGRQPTGGGGFSGATVYKQVVGANGVQVATFTGPDTTGASLTYVVYRSDVPSNQTAGVYQNQLEYIDTPIF